MRDGYHAQLPNNAVQRPVYVLLQTCQTVSSGGSKSNTSRMKGAIVARGHTTTGVEALEKPCKHIVNSELSSSTTAHLLSMAIAAVGISHPRIYVAIVVQFPKQTVPRMTFCIMTSKRIVAFAEWQRKTQYTAHQVRNSSSLEVVWQICLCTVCSSSSLDDAGCHYSHIQALERG